MPTIAAVAAAAGVSKTTVSHVLSGKRPVSPATRRTVLNVIDELGFQPNSLAQALRSRRTGTVAVLVPDVTNPFYPALARGLQRSLLAQDYLLLLADVGIGDRAVHAFLADAVQRRVDGIVIAALAVTAEDLRTVARARISVVSVGVRLPIDGSDVVSSDDEAVAFDATTYLVNRGHRRIANIGGQPGTPPALGRAKGYRAALEHAGLDLPDGMQVVGDWTRDGGERAMRRILEHATRPTAVFCANDLMAIGAMDAVIAAGLRVPQDVALVGVDDIEAASLVRPALTTMRIPADEIGQVAGSLLLERIGADTAPIGRSIRVSHELVVRDST